MTKNSSCRSTHASKTQGGKPHVGATQGVRDTVLLAGGSLALSTRSVGRSHALHLDINFKDKQGTPVNYNQWQKTWQPKIDEKGQRDNQTGKLQPKDFGLHVQHRLTGRSASATSTLELGKGERAHKANHGLEQGIYKVIQPDTAAPPCLKRL